MLLSPQIQSSCYNYILFQLFPVSLSSYSRVGHRILLRFERIVLLRSFKECNILLRSFFEFLATYETQKNDVFF